MENKKEIDATVHTTRVINIDDKPFDVYAGGKLARHFESGEEAVVPVFVAQLAAKHLIDRILQEKHSISNTLADTPLRRSLHVKIVPELEEEEVAKPLTDEEFRTQIKDQLEKQNRLNEELSGQSKSKDDEIKALKERLAKLEKPSKPKGRPKKNT